MSGQMYEFTFDPDVDLTEVEDTLTLAVLAAENLHGRALVRMDGSFRLDRPTRKCIIDAATSIGQQIARLFTGFLSKEFGEEAFAVRNVGAKQWHTEPM
ncbi:hypothetical protein ACFLQW_02300 [Candidatus Zixiibacteriota bacterium]